MTYNAVGRRRKAQLRGSKFLEFCGGFAAGQNPGGEVPACTHRFTATRNEQRRTRIEKHRVTARAVIFIVQQVADNLGIGVTVAALEIGRRPHFHCLGARTRAGVYSFR